MIFPVGSNIEIYGISYKVVDYQAGHYYLKAPKSKILKFAAAWVHQEAESTYELPKPSTRCTRSAVSTRAARSVRSIFPGSVEIEEGDWVRLNKNLRPFAKNEIYVVKRIYYDGAWRVEVEVDGKIHTALADIFEKTEEELK